MLLYLDKHTVSLHKSTNYGHFYIIEILAVWQHRSVCINHVKNFLRITTKFNSCGLILKDFLGRAKFKNFTFKNNFCGKYENNNKFQKLLLKWYEIH